MFKLTHLFGLGMALVLAGCIAGPVGKPVPKWKPPADVPRFGDWVVEPDKCLLRAATAEVTAETDGRLHNRSLIAIKLSTLMPLVTPPMVAMSGLPVPLPLDGGNTLGGSRTFRTHVEYAPHTVHHMNQPSTFIIVTYHPLNTTVPREAHFDTRGLVQGVAHLAKTCGK